MNYSSKLKNNMLGREITPFNVCKLSCSNTCRYSCTAKNAAKHPKYSHSTFNNNLNKDDRK